jgi:hypothetical protein
MHTALRTRLVASDEGFGEAATSNRAVHARTCAFVRISAQAS